MARFTFKLPDIGEGIAEAEIVAWHVKVGDTVEEDQQLADMMTDKATVEMELPVAGMVVELAGEVGDQIADRLDAGGDRDRGRCAAAEPVAERRVAERSRRESRSRGRIDARERPASPVREGEAPA